MTFILFFPFNLDIKISLILLLYSLTYSLLHSSSVVFINFSFLIVIFIIIIIIIIIIIVTIIIIINYYYNIIDNLKT